MGGFNLGKIPPINTSNRHSGKIFVFDKKLPDSLKFFYLKHGLYQTNIVFVKTMNILLQGDKITEEAEPKLICLEGRKALRVTLQGNNVVLLFSVPTWVTFLDAMLAMNLEYC